MWEIIKMCKQCNHQFKANSGSQQLCKKCQTRRCPSCGKEFIPLLSEIKRGGGKTCSRTCYFKSLKGRTPWNLGKKHRPETIKKMEKSHALHPGKTHSAKTRLKASKTFIANKHLGDKATNWKGGRITDIYGYIRIYSPNHPNNVNGYVLEHRLVAEKSLGRLLSRFEIVHHINQVKTDNRPKNLYLFANKNEHQKFHKKPYKLTSNIA